MKRILGILAVLAIAIPALAQMDSKAFSISVAASRTNTATYIIRGQLESVYCAIVDTVSTNTITITDDYGTLFTKAVSADAKYYPRVQGQTTAGAAQSWTWVSTGAANADTGTVTTTYFGEKIAMAGPVTVSIVGSSPVTQTNACTITLIYKQ